MPPPCPRARLANRCATYRPSSSHIVTIGLVTLCAVVAIWPIVIAQPISSEPKKKLKRMLIFCEKMLVQPFQKYWCNIFKKCKNWVFSWKMLVQLFFKNVSNFFYWGIIEWEGWKNKMSEKKKRSRWIFMGCKFQLLSISTLFKLTNFYYLSITLDVLMSRSIKNRLMTTHFIILCKFARWFYWV